MAQCMRCIMAWQINTSAAPCVSRVLHDSTTQPRSTFSLGMPSPPSTCFSHVLRQGRPFELI